MILLISFSLRIYTANRIFRSSDEVAVTAAVIRYFPRSIQSFNFLDDSKETSNPLGLLLQGHNIMPYAIGLFAFSFGWIFKIPMTEFIWNLFSIFLGIFSVLLIFLFINYLFDVRSALISALFIGLLPMQVYPSQSIGNIHHFINFLFLVGTIYFFSKFFKEESKMNAICASIFLSIYLLSSMIFPLIFILILFLGIIFVKEKNPDISLYHIIKKVISLFLNRRIILFPSLILSFFWMSNFISWILHKKFVGVIGHVFYAPSSIVGFHFSNFIESMIMTTNLVVMVIFIFCLLVSFKKPSFIKKSLFLFIWFTIYSFPFLMLVSRPAWTWTMYMFEAMGSLIIMLGIIIANLDKFFAPEHFLKLNFLKFILITIIASSFLLGDLSFIFQMKTIPNLFKTGIYGNFEGLPFPIFDDFGVKAAGYWIRANTNKTASIFANYYRTGAGIEPWVADYYFHRNTYSLYDGNINQSLRLFNKVKDKVDILILDAGEIDYFRDFLQKFYKTVEIIDETGKVQLIIYTRSKLNFAKLSIKNGNHLYDKTYSDFNSMLDCSFCDSTKFSLAELN